MKAVRDIRRSVKLYLLKNPLKHYLRPVEINEATETKSLIIRLTLKKYHAIQYQLVR